MFIQDSIYGTLEIKLLIFKEERSLDQNQGKPPSKETKIESNQL